MLKGLVAKLKTAIWQSKFQRCVMWATGGRPMRIEGHALHDMVANKPVYFYRDRYENKRWMAFGKWSLFRVDSEKPT